MSVQPSDQGGCAVIHLGGETAVVVPLYEYRMLKALERRATPGDLDEAQIDAAIAEHEAWVEAGRPGELTHDEAMARLLTDR
ncbi:MAG TPA: hypothetical protein VME19_10840 [Streptosporangiaceae bacterium]|nr:hypothetical protein [Streptosporangiaceae bacterium]